MRRVACVIVLWALTAPAAADDRPLSEAVSVAREGECLTADGLLPHLRTWLERDAIEDVFRTLATESLEDRKHNPGLEEARADVIVAGTCILVALVRWLGADEILVSESDILDGLIASVS